MTFMWPRSRGRLDWAMLQQLLAFTRIRIGMERLGYTEAFTRSLES